MSRRSRLRRTAGLHPGPSSSPGAFVLSRPGYGGPSKVSGQFIVVWKRSGQTWQMHRDIWNTH
jgi:hypothetical protein